MNGWVRIEEKWYLTERKVILDVKIKTVLAGGVPAPSRSVGERRGTIVVNPCFNSRMF